MDPKDFKSWNYSFKLPPGAWVWGTLDPRDGMTDDEIEALSEAAAELFDSLATTCELALLEEIDDHVAAGNCNEAKDMLDKLFNKQS